MLSLFLLIVQSCESDTSSFNENIAITPKSTDNFIVIEPNEALEVERFFIGETSFNLDETRESYVDVQANTAVFPVITTGLSELAEFEFDEMDLSKGICVRIKIRRKKASPRPDRCQGDCKCGMGFRCEFARFNTCDENGNPTPRTPALADATIFYNPNISIITVIFNDPIDWVSLNNE